MGFNFNRLWQFGVDDRLDSEQNRVIVLTNQLFFGLFFLANMYGVLFLVFGEYYLAFWPFFYGVWLLVGLVFNSRCLYVLARYNLIVCTSFASLHYSSLLGPESGLQYWTFAVACVSFSLFSPYQNRLKLGVALFIPVITLAWLEIFQYSVVDRYILDPLILKIVYFVMMGTIFLTIFFTLMFFYHSFHVALDNLKKSRAMVEKSSQLAVLARLSLGVCHEIRTPLTVLRCEAEDIVEEIDNRSAVKAYAESIMGQVDILDDVVKTMLRFGSEDSAKESLALNRVILEFSGLVVRSVEAEGIVVKLDLQDVPKTSLDKRGVFQVVMNLVSNSRDALDGGDGEIRISSYSGSYSFEDRMLRGVCLEIYDNGPGISNEVKTHLFDPYFTSKGPGHIGLGLSIVHRICHAHNGLIDVQSEPGETCFRVWFPIGDDAIELAT